MLVASLFATAMLGMLQEKTYAAYGPCWREAVFYTVRKPMYISSLLSLTRVTASSLAADFHILP